MSPPQKDKKFIREVSKSSIRRAFNKSQCLNDIKTGALVPAKIKDRHLDVPSRGNLYCTRSQYIIYRDSSGRFVAGVHQYLRPDGTLGASGKPDPKRLLVNGVLWVVRSK